LWLSTVRDAIVQLGLYIGAIQVAPYAKKTVDGIIEDLEASLYEELLAKVDYSVYANKQL
jgi:hypothetical protein